MDSTKAIWNATSSSISSLSELVATAVSEAIMKGKTIFMNGGTSPKLLDLNNPYLFRIRAGDMMVAKVAAKYASEETKAKKVGMIYSTDAFGTAAQAIISEYYKATNIPFYSEGLNTGDKDFTGQLLKLKNSGIESLIMWCQDDEIPIVARQAKELNMNMPKIASAVFANILNVIDTSVSDGTFIVTDFVPTSKDQKTQDFIKSYKARFNTEPLLHAIKSYDAIYVLADAVKRANSTDKEAVRKALLETNNFKGAMITYSSNSKGELVHSTNVAMIKNKGLELIKTINE